jgi:hypothetical protein
MVFKTTIVYYFVRTTFKKAAVQKPLLARFKTSAIACPPAHVFVPVNCKYLLYLQECDA